MSYTKKKRNHRKMQDFHSSYMLYVLMNDIIWRNTIYKRLFFPVFRLGLFHSFA